MQQLSDLDLNSVSRILNLLDGVDPQEPATVAQLKAAVEGLAWKDSVRASTTGNINIASPGATHDGVTLATNDRLLVGVQTAPEENGIYIYNGAATPLTRALDASTFEELESAVVSVEEGTTNEGTSWRQTEVNGTIDVDPLVWVTFGSSVPAASETVAGIAEIATQTETDTGTDDTRIVTPLKLATWSGRTLRHNATFGNGTDDEYVITHNFSTRDVMVEVYRNASPYDTIICDVERTSTSAVTLKFAAAVPTNSLRAVVRT